jgi:DNA-binding transcriptional regulator YiaG
LSQKYNSEVLATLRNMADEAKVNKPKKVELPEVNVKELLKELGLSQSEFSRVFKLPLATIKQWCQMRRGPRGAARVLLLLIKSKPLWVAEMLKDISVTE